MVATVSAMTVLAASVTIERHRGASVSIVQTVLVFVGIPAGIIAVVAVRRCTASRMMRQPNRYRPGRPWDLPAVLVSCRIRTPSLRHAGVRAAIEGGITPTATGGASGEW